MLQRGIKNISKIQVRHNSSLPPILTYIKDKGTEIPFASKLLTEEEYTRYILYRQVKKGNYKWLKEYVKLNPLMEEEKQTIVKYIHDLKGQPFSVPNLGIGYICTSFGTNTIYYSATGALLNNFGIFKINPMIMLTCMDCIGLYSIYYGLKLISNELRSPYYNYEEMLRICNSDETKK
jgi:hypothetical protein